MRPPIRILVFTILLLAKLTSADAQSSVGVNTTTPNNNAVLELVSPASDQGFLVPRLSTSQREAMTTRLSSFENGLMVYDQDLNFFFYWKNDEWIPGLGALSITPAGGDLDGTYPNPIIRIGAVTSEKLQDEAVTTEKIAERAITSAKIEDGAITTSKLEEIGLLPGPYGNAFVSLQLDVDSKGRIRGITEKQISISSENIIDQSILNEDIADRSITIQKLDPEDNSNKILTVNENGSVEWLSKELFQTSSLPANHIFVGDDSDKAAGLKVTGDITLESDGTSAIVQIREGAISSDKIANNTILNEDLNKSQIPLSGFGAAIDKINLGSNKIINLSDPVNSQDASTKSYVDNSILESETNDEDKDDTNELNTSLDLDGTTLEVTDAGGTLSVDLNPQFATNSELSAAISASETNDDDKDGTNELNTSLDLDGTTLEVTDAGGTLSVDLNPEFATDSELSAAISASETNDEDKDDTNELNSGLDLDGTTLEVTDAGGTLSVDLNPQFATDSELSAAISASETNDEDKDNANELNNSLDLDGTTLEVTDAGGTLSVDLNPEFATDSELSAAISASEAGDDDKDDTNELNNSLDLDGTALEVTDAGGTLSVDLNPQFATDSELSAAISASETNDDDKDDANELNNSLDLDGTALEVTDAGGTLSVDLNPQFATDSELSAAISASEAGDEDKDDTNELNTSLDLDGTALEVTDAGGTLSIDLNPQFATDSELSSAISASEAGDEDKDDTNELNNSLDLDGTALEVTDAGGTLSVDLNPQFATDSELSAAISASETNDEDKDDTNELNTSLDLDGTALEVTDAGGTLSIDLNPEFATDSELSAAISASETNDEDKDDTNELNTSLDLDGTALEVTDAGGTLSIDLNPQFATDSELSSAISASETNDEDKDDTNELNTSLDLDGTTLEVTDAGGTLSVDLNPQFATDSELSAAISASETNDEDKDDTNELNSGLDLDGTALEVTDAGGTLSVDLNPQFATDSELSAAISASETGDEDKDDTNELNTSLDLDGTTLEVTDAGGTLSVDLNPQFATDSELSAAISASETNDEDKDDTNELNSGLDLDGTTLEVTDAGGTLSVDLNPQFATDSELSAAISASEAGDEDKDDTNELNTSLDLDGTALEVTDAGGTLSIDLNPQFATDSELSSAISASEAGDEDKDDTNELNNSLDLDGTALEVTDAGGTLSVDLNPQFATDSELSAAISASETNDEDKDDTNELNTSLDLDGTALEVTDAGGTLSIDLNPEFATDSELSAAISASETNDEDKDDTNELNTSLDLDGTALEVTDAGGTLSIDLNPQFATDSELSSAISASETNDEDKDDTNELNTSLDLDGTTLEVTDAGGTLSVDLNPQFATDSELSAAISASETNDEDKDDTNELNSGLDLDGTALEVTDAGGTLSVDLNPQFATDSELSAAISASETGDEDKDDTNELNTSLDLDGTTLEVTDAGGTLSVDLNPQFATDSELSAAISASETNDEDKDDTNELNSGLDLDGTTLEVTDAGGTLSVDLNPQFATDSELSAAISASETNDEDKDDANELNTSLDLDGTILEVTDAGGTKSVDLDGIFATDSYVNSEIQDLLDELNELREPVAFEVFLNGSTSSVSNGPVPFNREVFEDGGNFILSQHYFSVPKDGNYHFDAQLTLSFNNNLTRTISIYVDEDETGSLDGIRVARAIIAENSDQVISIGVSKTLKLEEGNRVYVRYEGPSTFIINGRADSYFSGHIIK